MGFSGRWVAWLGIALLIGVAVPARIARCEDLDTILKKGNELRAKGRDREALEEFQRAALINDSPRVTAQIALAEQALGMWAEAGADLNKALAADSDPWIAKNRAALERARGTIRQHVATLEVWGAPDGAEVLVDGQVVGRLPQVGPLGIATDEIELQVRAPGYAETNRTLRTRIGSLVREHVELRRSSNRLAKAIANEDSVAPVASPPPPPVLRQPVNDGGAGGGRDLPPPSASPSSRTPLILVVGGLAAVALGFGVVEHVVWRNKVGSFGSMNCDAALSNRGSAICGQLYDAGNQARTLALAGYIGGGALAVTAAIIYLTRPDEPSGNAGRVACAIAPLPARIDCTLRF
jgi:hypothetical protein